MVNVHYLADQIERHLARPQAAADRDFGRARSNCSAPAAAWSRRCRSSATGRSSTSIPTRIWIDGVKPNLERLAAAFDPARHGRAAAAGADRDQHRLCRPRRLHHGRRRPADAARRARGCAVRLCRRRDPARPRCSPDAPAGAFLVSPLFDRAAEAGRLHGLRLEGVWMHVGTPEAVAAAEAAIAAAPPNGGLPSSACGSIAIRSILRQ